MSFIKLTQEEKAKANEVNLVTYLQMRGEKLKRVGNSYFVKSLKGISIFENKWYDHYNKKGGYSVAFLREFYGYSYIEAVIELLGEKNIKALNVEENNNLSKPIFKSASKKILTKSETKTIRKNEPIAMPEKANDNKNVIDYLCNKRFINKSLVKHFISEGAIYQSKDKSNTVFVGNDENGKAVFGCIKGTYVSKKGAFTQTIKNSNCDYSFNFTNIESEVVFVFEAPIDMLSFMTIMKSQWNYFNYIALDGVSEKPLLKFLEINKHISEIYLCLDNDVAGFEATEKLSDILVNYNYKDVGVILPQNKDFNEDLKEKNGIAPKPCVVHKNYKAYSDKMDRLLFFYKNNNKITEESILTKYNTFKEKYKSNSVIDNNELLDSLVIDIVTLLKGHLKHIGKDVSENQIFTHLKDDYRAYKDKGNIKNKIKDLDDEFQKFEKFKDKSTLTRSEKVEFIKNMLEITCKCIKVNIKLTRVNEKQENSLNIDDALEEDSQEGGIQWN